MSRLRSLAGALNPGLRWLALSALLGALSVFGFAHQRANCRAAPQHLLGQNELLLFLLQSFSQTHNAQGKLQRLILNHIFPHSFPHFA